MDDRSRMIFDVPPEVQMAIRLRAIKDSTTTGEVVAKAVRFMFPASVQEAEAVLTRCPHQWVDPSNERVEANGYKLCVKCGRLEERE